MNNIRALKMYNWEAIISENTLNAREYEMSLLYRSIFINTSIDTFMNASDVFIKIVMLGSLSFWGIPLVPSEIFAGMNMIGSLKGKFLFFPRMYNNSMSTKISHDKL